MDSHTTLSVSVIDLRRRAGLLNITEVADLLGIPVRRFNYFLESSRLFRPQVRIDRRRRGYYTAADIDQIRDLIDKQ
jgi:DNA-binding transcriptional MerR regulator